MTTAKLRMEVERETVTFTYRDYVLNLFVRDEGASLWLGEITGPDDAFRVEQVAKLDVRHLPDCLTLAREVRVGALSPAIFADWLEDRQDYWKAEGDADKVLEVLRFGW